MICTKIEKSKQKLNKQNFGLNTKYSIVISSDENKLIGRGILIKIMLGWPNLKIYVDNLYVKSCYFWWRLLFSELLNLSTCPNWAQTFWAVPVCAVSNYATAQIPQAIPVCAASLIAHKQMSILDNNYWVLCVNFKLYKLYLNKFTQAYQYEL